MALIARARSLTCISIFPLAIFAVAGCGATRDEGAEPTPASQQAPLTVGVEATTDPGPVPQVVGGTNAALGQFPWQVQMGQSGDPTLEQATVFPHWCGASLISPHYAVTAAHCVFGQNEVTFVLRMGIVQRSLAPSSAERIRGIHKITINPSYTTSTSWQTGNDVAVLELNEPVTFSTAVRPIALTLTDPPVGGSSTVSGWGRLVGFGAIPDILQSAPLPVQSAATCNTFFTGPTVLDNMLCAGSGSGDTSSCNGDSGGPLVYRPNNTRPYDLVGIVSWGPTSCAAYSVFTRVTSQSSWIRSVATDAYLDGDVNLDGCVNSADLSLVSASLGQPVPANVLVDQNNNGTVDTGDYLTVLANTGHGC